MKMSISIRRGTIEDSYACFLVFSFAVDDLIKRLGLAEPDDEDISDETVLAPYWERRRPLFEHLARTSDEYWLAERESKIVGYARSILRDGVRELTEFFVHPKEQAAGIGKELLAKVFPKEGAENRLIIATFDTRAQIRYMKSGVLARFPISEFSCTPKAVEFSSDLRFEAIAESPENLAHLAAIDKKILGHERTIDQQFLLKERQGFLYWRNNEVVGYGYVGFRSGPFAVLDAADFQAVLSHAETEASKNHDSFAIEIPMMNRGAADFVLQRGYKLDPFYTLFMSEKVMGNFENYIFTSPPFFI
jgi:GNAT superfamily N-acetyltransferase